MYKIFLGEKLAMHREDESVLETLLRTGLEVPFSCKAGTCQTCLLKLEEGKITKGSQAGLPENYVKKNLVLPCMMKPESDLVLSIPETNRLTQRVQVIEKNFLADDICQLKLESESEFAYETGQYIQIINPKSGETRCYSLASLHGLDSYLELHIKKIPKGEFSEWIFSSLQVGEFIEIFPPEGNFVYQKGNKRENLLFIGTGTGLAPLYGLIKEALMVHEHEGNLYLFHGSRFPQGMYLHQELKLLENTYPNFHYNPCVSGGFESDEYKVGRSSDHAIWGHDLTDNYLVYISGFKEMVTDTFHMAVDSGISPSRVFHEVFELSHNIRPEPKASDQNGKKKPGVQQALSYEFREEAIDYFQPDTEMWEALEEGKILNEIVDDFYHKVYKDPILSPFFEGISIDRAIQKQYSFLYDAFTGKKSFIGDLPRNAHHWMVITDELFNYREKLFEESLRKFDFPDHLIVRWLGYHERFRSRMVKSQPWDKIAGGVIISTNKFEEIVAELEMICDNCEGEISMGEKVRFHQQLGEVYCGKCSES